MRKTKLIVLMSLVILMFYCNVFSAGFTIGVMQDKAGVGAKYNKLIDYFKTKGILVKIFPFKDYESAATMFSNGMINSMFSGSGVAGSFIMKDIATPLVRPVTNEKWSTYWAVVLAKKGAPEFNYKAEYFKGKKVAFCSLASSGEFYFQSIKGAAGEAAEIRLASSHGEAIDLLNVGTVEIAIVKNRVWDQLKSKYPEIVEIGADSSRNPDGTLLVSNKLDKNISMKLEKIFTALKDDQSPGAKEVKESLKATEFIKTTREDFKSTLELLKRAGVDKSFNFQYSYGDKLKH